MQETDKERILNFLLRNESISDFESWVYNDSNLESRIGSELYLELIGINYNDKFVVDDLSKIIMGNYISQDDFVDFKFKKVLLASGWYPNRKIEVQLSNLPITNAVKNALKIIEEFGGLEIIFSERWDSWAMNPIEFLIAPYKPRNMKEYGLDKELVCFAGAHYGYIDLFVDENNKFYHMDNVVSEYLYEYKGPSFEQMMIELLGLVDGNNFHKVENPHREIFLKKREEKMEKINNPIGYMLKRLFGLI